MHDDEMKALAQEASQDLPWVETVAGILKSIGFETGLGSPTFLKAIQGAAYQFMCNNGSSYLDADEDGTAELQRWVLLRLALMHRRTACEAAFESASEDQVEQLDTRLADAIGTCLEHPSRWHLPGDLPGNRDLRLHRIGFMLFKLDVPLEMDPTRPAPRSAPEPKERRRRGAARPNSG